MLLYDHRVYIQLYSYFAFPSYYDCVRLLHVILRWSSLVRVSARHDYLRWILGHYYLPVPDSIALALFPRSLYLAYLKLLVTRRCSIPGQIHTTSVILGHLVLPPGYLAQLGLHILVLHVHMCWKHQPGVLEK